MYTSVSLFSHEKLLKFLFIVGLLILVGVVGVSNFRKKNGSGSILTDIHHSLVDINQTTDTADSSKSNESLNSDVYAFYKDKVTLADLQAAVRNGSPQALPLVYEHYLSNLPNYEQEVLPALKTEAVRSLLNLFTDDDWENWRAAFYANDGKPTAARTFVSDLKIVNKALGRHAETAALLFSELYKTTNLGQHFDVEEFLYSLKSDLAVGAGELNLSLEFYDFDIGNDKDFIALFENERGRIVVEVINLRPSNLQKNIQFLFGVNPEHSGKEVFETIVVLLKRLAIGVSPSVRQVVIQDELTMRHLELFAEKNREVRKTIAEIYALVSVDALEIGDVKEAGKYLEKSLSFDTGLRAQKIVAAYVLGETEERISFDRLKGIKTDTAGFESGTDSTRSLIGRKKTGNKDQGGLGRKITSKSSRIPENKGEGFHWFPLLFLFIVFVVGLFFVGLYLARRRAIRDALRLKPDESDFGGLGDSDFSDGSEYEDLNLPTKNIKDSNQNAPRGTQPRRVANMRR